MFDIGWSEMALVLLVALIVIGPKDLPRVARTMGQWVGKGRAMAREFQRALEDMAREAELDKVKSEIEKAGRTDLGKTIEKTVDPSGELSRAFDPNAPGGKRASSDQPAGPREQPARAGAAPPAPVQPGSPAPAGNGAGGAHDPSEPTGASAPTAPAERESGAAASHGAGAAEELKEATRAGAPAEPS
jgi:sec-independent protein translocase protein TatB